MCLDKRMRISAAKIAIYSATGGREEGIRLFFLSTPQVLWLCGLASGCNLLASYTRILWGGGCANVAVG